MKPLNQHGIQAKLSLHSAVFLTLLCSASVAKVNALSFEEINTPFSKSEAWGSSWGDFNNDRCPDLFVNHHRDQAGLYKNNCDGTFKDVSQKADVDKAWLESNKFSDQHGAAWGDIDSDGDQDIYITTGARWDGALLINEDGVLRNRTVERMVQEDREGRSPFWIDYDNNRLLDMVIQSRTRTWTWEQNDLDGTFFDSNWLTGVNIHETINFANLIDLDNQLPLEYVATPEGTTPVAAFELSTMPFTDITANIPSVNLAVDTAVGDFDGDLLNDMVVLRGRLRRVQTKLFANNTIETWFTVSPGAEDKTIRFKSPNGNLEIDMYSFHQLRRYYFGSEGYNPEASAQINSTTYKFSLDASDISNHGIKPHSSIEPADQGIYIGYDPITEEWEVNLANGGRYTTAYFVIKSSESISDLEISSLAGTDLPLSPVLLRNTGLGFEGTTEPLVAHYATGELSNPVSCNGITSGDFDNDMDIDLYMACSGGVENIANILYENDGTGQFNAVPMAGGARGPIGSSVTDGHSLADNVTTADYDGDGKLDLFVTNGVQLFPVRFDSKDYLFRNNTVNTNNWLQLDLVGTTSNRDGLGAKVYATTNGITQLREQNGGHHRWAQNHQRIHFGLADNTTVDLRIEWPSGIVDTHLDVNASSLYEVIEGDTITAISQGPVAPDPGETGPPVDDVVNILRAKYFASNNRIWIQATSDLEPLSSAILTATTTLNDVEVELGKLNWNSNNQAYQKTFSNLAAVPECITVTSSGGGSNSMAVEGTGFCDGDVVEMDNLTIEKAIYFTSQQKLWIRTSSTIEPQGSDTISATYELNQVTTDLGQITWKSGIGYYQQAFFGINSAPDSITITNPDGDTATAPVTIQ